MGFSNPITGGEDLIRSGIRSPNYVAGLTGWRIAQDGSAEFNNVTVRGTLYAGSIVGPVTLTGDLTMAGAGRILTAAAGNRIVLSSGVSGTIQFYTGDAAETNTPYISESVQGAAGQHTPYMALSSGQIASRGDAYLQLNGGRQDGGAAPFFDFWAFGTRLGWWNSDSAVFLANLSISQLSNLYLRGYGDTNHRIVVPAVAPTYSTAFNVDGPVIVGFNNWILATGNNSHWQMAVGANYINIFGALCVGNGSTNDGYIDPESVTMYGGTSGISMRQRGRGANDAANRVVMYPGDAGANGGEGFYVWQNSNLFHLSQGGNVHFPMGLPGLAGNTAIIATASWQLGFVPSGRAYKVDIEDLGAGEDNPLWKFRPRRFRWNEETVANGKEENERLPAGLAGFIAEELAELAPDVVCVGEGGAPSGIDTHVLLAYLVAAVQTLKGKIR